MEEIIVGPSKKNTNEPLQRLLDVDTADNFIEFIEQSTYAKLIHDDSLSPMDRSLIIMRFSAIRNFLNSI